MRCRRNSLFTENLPFSLGNSETKTNGSAFIFVIERGHGSIAIVVNAEGACLPSYGRGSGDRTRPEFS